MRRGVTLVELIVAVVIALVGITAALMLAAEVIEASANVRQRNALNAEAKVALLRIRTELEQASSATMENGALGIVGSGGKMFYKTGEIDGVQILARCQAGETPNLSNAVAKRVCGIDYVGTTLGAQVRTLALTVGNGKNTRKLEEILRQWGKTL